MTAHNRGKQSSDDKWFAHKWHPIFSTAVDDLCYLLSRGYSENSALHVVGNRYRLQKRQRLAILRISCSNHGITIRNNSRCIEKELEGNTVEIDGFNLLIFLESMLSGAYIFKGRDGLYRDISSVHGSYKRVIKTEEAILLTGKILSDLKVKSVIWYFDQPVSNSGRLKTNLLQVRQKNNFNWEVNLVFNPDKILAQSKNVVITSDGWILEQVNKWFNFSAYIIDNHIIEANIIAI